MRRTVLVPIWSRFKDGALSAIGVGLGLVLGWTILLSPIGVLNLIDAYREHQREERLLKCLQEAKRDYAVALCEKHFSKQD